ncbi:MAG: alpha-glucan family phosphorylase [Deltaproteobacteria bacterium]|nr:alpha-glucan family phosphorylase [Deltaproteobacteria bacterium]MBW2019588.1 alpha-glucan family phosphorylase [Deltaproteobacteria bacterium]MBW2074390.1 alpha-glucan family phosphorylase [Deltaproteobacteria bacterium]RLB82845.1 MAG: alpha-glucan phosphorylase [Deltaproteobacteria bacterium]
MKAIYKYNVLAKLPDRLKPLERLAYNLWFSWHHDIGYLFSRMDAELWESSKHNPVYMLGAISQKRLEQLAEDAGFLAQMDRVYEQLEQYLSVQPSPIPEARDLARFGVAYFSAEFGLAECLPIYSGGLGVLAGDYLKSASDLNFPAVGVGLFYHEGYFQQYLNADGWQQEAYPENDISTMPASLMTDENGQPVMVEVSIQGEPVKIQIWRLMVGRVPLYLLDTNIKENSPEHRYITSRLYGGDWDMRLRQEIVLGIGGVRALRALGVEASAYHMNEGHSAFSALERIRILKNEHSLSFDAAREFVVATNTFTTHTPVPAGNDMFSPDLMHTYFEDYVQSLGIAFKVFLGFGRQEPGNDQETFSMTVLALRLSAHSNGVSRLHASVSRNMWHKIWPKNPMEDIPIYPITNGIHIPSWISKDMAELFDRYLGPNWIEDPDSQKVWKQVKQIPDSELWRTHERRRERLVAFARRRLQTQLKSHGASAQELETAAQVLNPEILTIGFGRRFANYKRATLILQDQDRLVKLLTHPERPIQIIIAGKAHPQDAPAKELIRRIIHFANLEEVRHRFVFIQDYNIRVARMMLQGCDVWINTPRRPLEACGTSGMKAIPNGVLNLSTLDGWWDEGYDPSYGWAIGRGETYEDHHLQDEVESRDIYNLLEREIVPLFYDRGLDNLPRGWLEKMKAAMCYLCPIFNCHRMLQDYTNQCYISASRRYNELSRDDMKGANELAQWRQKILTNWDQIRINRIHVHGGTPVPVSGYLKIGTDIFLNELKPEDVDVDIYFGPLSFKDEFTERETIQMKAVDSDGNGNHHFEGEIPCTETGKYGFTIRVMPSRQKMETPYTTGLVIWAQDQAIVNP